MKRSRPEIAQAVARLQNDGELIELVELAREERISVPTLTRWIVAGKGGLHLDGLHHPRRGWLSSRAALRRMRAKLERANAERSEA